MNIASLSYRASSHVNPCSLEMLTNKLACRARFEGAWKVVEQVLLDYIRGEGMHTDAIEWYERNLDYNIPGGKLDRGMSVVDTAEIIKGPRWRTSSTSRLSCLAGASSFCVPPCISSLTAVLTLRLLVLQQ
ncbi:hypothetical protein IW261DRAFT_1568535 [Armillaria novae-zelandiae]|uniref:Uncharacterized protein n=1 Tax=Armillaria novae-zelandiae TaxID=153914 RepID=A0AA39NZ31_9AGAR|nr:hypothetical protein IW261DRAFT_1568535 [Armillaria novae-zelandiae]